MGTAIKGEFDVKLTPVADGGPVGRMTLEKTFHVAVDSQAGILPIAFIGLHRLMPHPRRILAAGGIAIAVGTPLPPPAPGPHAADELMASTRAAIGLALGESA